MSPEIISLTRVRKVNIHGLVRQGEIIAYPTDTFYGLGVETIEIRIA